MNNEAQKRLVLVDGYSFLFRAYHSMPPLTNSDGVVVGALYGYSNMILKIRNELAASHFAVILDHGDKTFRNEIYPEYKANRPPAPEDLKPQFPLVREVTEAMNIATLDQSGVEADDIIATLALAAEQQDLEVTIISSDKDLMQLVSPRIKLFDPMKQKIIDEEAVFAKFSVYPDKILDLLALSGDSADNIPGVPTIGPKTAAELLNNYDSLEGIYQNIAAIKQPKRRETLINNKEQAFLSRKLVALKQDVAVIENFSELAVQEINQIKLAKFFNKHGFKTLLSKIGSELLTKEENNNYNFHIVKITSESDLKIAFKKVNLAAEIFIANWKQDLFIVAESEIFHFVKIAAETDLLGHNLTGYLDQTLESSLEEILLDKSIKKIFFDFKLFYRDYHFSKNDFVADNLVHYAENFLDYRSLAFLANEPDNDFCEAKSELSSEQLIARFSELYLRTYKYQNYLIEQQQFALFQHLDLPFLKILAGMEKTGFKISVAELDKLTLEFAKHINLLQQDIFKLAGTEFNIASPKQLGEILFNKLAIETKKKSKKSKNLSTSQQVLEELSIAGYEIATKILVWRRYSKLKNTYSEALPKQISAKTGRVHSIFSNTTTSTGRISSLNPNLQNIPVRSAEGDKIRETFICASGYKLISADYSQIELRLLAEIGQVTKLQDAFKQNIDIHAATASEVFAVAENKIDAELRRKAKTINFGIIYGISSFGLAERLNITRTEAKDYIELYFSRYPEIKNYMDSTIANCKKNGYVETILGRKLFFNNLNSNNFALRNFAERAVINAPLQGSAADIIKVAMLNIAEQIALNNLPMKLVLQVHDELIYEVKEDFTIAAKNLIKQHMENAIKLSTPLIVEVNSGDNWHEIH
jgi:DNA polymerase-1